MKILPLLIIPTLGIASLTACSGHAGDEHDEHEGHHHAHEATHESHDEINLAPEVAERLGVRVDTVAVTDFGSALEVAGVIEPSADAGAAVSAPAAGILTLAPGITVGKTVAAGQLIGTVKAGSVTGGDPDKVARIEMQAAKAELDRLTPLWEERLVTATRYNEAKAAYERARAAYSGNAAAGRVTAPVSGVLTSVDAATGQYIEAGSVIATLGNSSKMTLRADVPARNYARLGNVIDARVVIGYSGEELLMSRAGGKFGGASTVSRAGYVPVTFTFSGDGSIPPGTAVDVFLITDAGRPAVTVPRSAIVEQQGNLYVYEQLDEDCYRKLPITTGNSDGHNVEITSGLAGGEHIVVEGASVITLAAASGAVPEGHSHQH